MARVTTIGTFAAQAALYIYSGLGSVVYPFSGPFLRARARRGKEDRERRAERYGYPSWDRPNGPLVWLHAASVGESLAIMPLIERMESFGINLVLTTGTVTSAAIVEKRVSKLTIHQYVPMDVGRAVRRFLDHWQPDLAIFAESEIWPATIRELSKRDIPQVLVNARMSDRSNERWQKRPALARAIFRHLSQVIAQSELDGERFRNLGAPWVSVAGNLKVDVGMPVANEKEVATMVQSLGKRPRWVAVSTHDGEEALAAEVHKMVRAHAPGLLSIIVPRHPDRADQIRKVLEEHGLVVVTRSSGEPVEEATDVLLGDTIGEMGFYLRLAPIAFMGKSLSATGGQNPLEPAVVACAVLSGRHVENFRDTYQQLLDGGGAKLVKDEKMLAAYVLHLLRNPNQLTAMRQASRATVAKMSGALERTSKTLDPYIMPLRVKAGLERRTMEDVAQQAGQAK